MRRGSLTILCLGLATLALSACDSSDARKVLGLEKVTPDEFKVVSRAPLSMPPDYGLRPPAPGAIRPQEQTIQQRAQGAITGNTVARDTAPASSGEAALLAHAGAARVNPDIRDMLERENSSLASADQTFLDQLMFWRRNEDRSPVVDAQRESQRLRENAAQGLPSNQGDIPTITRRKRGPLEGIF